MSESDWKIQTPSPQHFILQLGDTNIIEFNLLPGLHHLTTAQRNALVASMSSWVANRVGCFDPSKTKTVRIADGRMDADDLVINVSLDDSGRSFPLRGGKGCTVEYFADDEWRVCPDGIYTLDGAYGIWRHTNTVEVNNGQISRRLEKVNRVIMGEGNYQAKISGTEHLCYRDNRGVWWLCPDGVYLVDDAGVLNQSEETVCT